MDGEKLLTVVLGGAFGGALYFAISVVVGRAVRRLRSRP